MLLKKLAELADSLDSKGYHDEAAQVDAMIKFIIESAKKVKWKCKCAECKEKGPKHKCKCVAHNSDGMCACP